jgi:secretion/DNA translocation related TadE-like protein
VSAVRPPRRPEKRRDRGSASIWALGIGLGVVLLGLGVAAVGTALVARQRAQTAADLGALAGAVLVLHGEPAACARAADLVAANGGRLAGCRAEALDLIVTAEVEAVGVGTARASARAGPVRSAVATGAALHINVEDFPRSSTVNLPR